MEYTKQMESVSVLGPAGKMGSGILTLLAIEMGKLHLEDKTRQRVFVLNAVDVSNIGLYNLLGYVRTQLLKYAEKNIVELRAAYEHREDLIENQEIINEYVTEVMTLINTSTRLDAAYDSHLVFDAVKEDKNLKAKLFSQIRENNPKTLFLTNTSSIPIGELDREAGLNGRIIGFHFYNPPIVQRLLEIIKTDTTVPELTELADQLARSMRKVIVYSKDKAGFIGNGHFMRDALFAIKKAEKLSRELGWAQAIYIVDTITRDLLLRPMGIFQLMDYVGIDVTKFILESMQSSFPEERLQHDLLDSMVGQKVLGGQFADGSQKNGFFKYEKGRITEVYDVNTEQYQIVELLKGDCLMKMGTLPAMDLKWKVVMREANRQELLEKFFEELKQVDSLACRMALEYGRNSKAIAQMLVDTGVAASEQDVNIVLETGFYHAYGPINEYFN